MELAWLVEIPPPELATIAPAISDWCASAIVFCAQLPLFVADGPFIELLREAMSSVETTRIPLESNPATLALPPPFAWKPVSPN